jgi:FKBP-type peptidyl-prolyl cis-trans isomerase
MNRILQSLILSAAAFLCACSSDDGPVSPTVNPSNPAALGQQAAAPGSVQTTYSGLKYEVLRAGNGPRPNSYSRVKVHYHGTLQNGTVFDSSVQRGQPATFGLDQVIAGWKEGIPLMQTGAKYRFTVPPHLAYGARGMPPKIGPNETLIFDVELLEVLY